MQLRAMMPKVTCVMAGSNMRYNVASVDFRKCDGFIAVVGFAPAHVYQPYGASSVACIIGPLVELTKHYLDEGAVGWKIEVERHSERLIIATPRVGAPRNFLNKSGHYFLLSHSRFDRCFGCTLNQRPGSERPIGRGTPK
jgi:hypothetical protein